MIKFCRKCLDNNRIRLCIKCLFSVLILFIVLQAFFIDGIKSYYTVKEYSYQNDFAADQIAVAPGNQISQHFIARGNKITNLTIFVNDTVSQTINITLLDLNNKTIREENVNVSALNVGSWNRVGFDCDITRGSEYTLQIYSENGLGSLIIDYGDKPETYIHLETEMEDTGAGLAVGIQQTYAYITWASFFELAFMLAVYIILALGLCYAIFNAEKLICAWDIRHSGISVVYAIYFAVSLILVFNPIDAIRTKVESFERVMGAGLISNVDTTRRISNFNHWYIYFAVAVILFFALINYMRQKELRDEQKKVLNVLDQIVVLANVNLLLRCITYFADKSNMQTIFYYSTAFIMMIVLASVAYLVFGLDKRINAASFAKLMIIAFCLSYPVAIISQYEWQGGKLLFGCQLIITIAIIILAYFLQGKKKCPEGILTFAAATVALIPFVTSFFIEFINILNQYEVFVYHVRRYYAFTILVFLIIASVIFFIARKRILKIEKWKCWVYTWLIFGITCLQQQIPLENTYNADIFETANSSILISDFLNFGNIPIVQHYGGHMMTGVWEGILYAVINNDNAGAIFSPYGGYLTPVLAVLFFLLVRKLLDDETAFLTVLFFPFMGAWSYYGLGMLVCVAVWFYLKNNTYWRAALVWLAFIWSAIYRLDLGFSIGFACIVALAIYVVIYKNWKAAKQLIITLLSWGVFGGGLWCVLCLIKHINPINRLIEFLMINLSNQNWAYAGIGNAGNTLFSWCYIIVPFVIAGSLCYVILSKKFREETTLEIWIALLILGFSYFSNFSRGLVRHSLAETATTIVLWDAFIYMALFVASYKRKRELFLPVFIVLIMSSTILTTTANYNTSTIGDYATSRVGDFTQGWTLDRFAYEDLPKNSDGSIEEPKTYWRELADNKTKVNRAEWVDDLKRTIKPYEIVINELLGKDETFVDFINKTFVYSAINRQNPVYVSQSPLQLSGEFTQEMFVEEMDDIPLVLMPVNDDRAANSLDGIINSYRCYKVAEYIYQNYVPLCRYGNTFAIWCLPERYEEFKQKAVNLVEGNDYVDLLFESDQIWLSNCERRIDDNTGERIIAFTGVGPIVADINNFIDLSAYCGSSVKMSVEYNTDIEGEMQLFYTTDYNENYVGEKVSTVHIAGTGTAEFIVPVTEYTRLRLDIPEGSSVAIRSLKVSSPVSYIEYGYDNSTQTTDENGNVWSTYDNGFHTYNLAYLPNIWANGDSAIKNTEYAELQYTNGYYVFEQDSITSKENGNYLLFKATYDGTDAGRNYYSDDETIGATVKVGVYKNGIFEEKYQYNVTLKEGSNEYIIRISNDYYWYSSDVNAVKVTCDSVLYDVSMRILEGD